MPSINNECLRAYRQHTFHLMPELRLKSKNDAVDFVNERGFTHFWPNKDILLPNIWTATVGDRPVPNNHDDPGHITWGWKDEILGTRQWFYARILCRRNTMISIKTLPNFYALSPNYGDPENDYLEDYRQGLLTQEAKNIYETLLREGALNTLELRRAAHLTSTENKSRFNRALDELQVRFRILPIGISSAGRWHYAFIYDLVTNHFPDLIRQSSVISEFGARRTLIEQYICSVGMAQERDIMRLFGWGVDVTRRTINTLVQDGKIITDDDKSKLFLPELISI